MEFKMDEFKFVLRCLVFTAALMFISQYKINHETLEAKAQHFLVDSPTAQNLRDVAAGGVMFIQNSIEDGTRFIKRKMAQNDGGNRHEPTKNRENY
jgi:hypothetical protein